jgi:hypothetical protein
MCREPIEQKRTGRPRQYCGDTCRSTAYRRRKGQQSRAYHKAQQEQKRLEALPMTERVMDVEKDEPVYKFGDGRRIYRCLTCSKLFEAKREVRKKYRQYCSNACEEKAKYHWHKLIDAYEVLHQQHSRASWPIWRRIEAGKLSPLCPQCGKPFEPNFGKLGRPRKYCGDACRKAAYERRWRTAHHGKPREHRYADCPACGERFDRTDSLGRRSRTYCSRQCSQKRRNAKRRLRKTGVLPPAKGVGHPAKRRVKRRRQAEREPLAKGWKRVGGFVTYVGE